MNTKIIICPNSYKKEIISLYRKDQFFLDLKLISKEELINSINGKVNELAIPFMMEQYQFTYHLSKEVFNYLPFIDVNKDYSSKKLQLLKELKQELINKKFITYNSYLKRMMNDQNVDIVGYSCFDKELSNLLSSLNVKTNYINERSNVNKLKLRNYLTQEDEVFYTLNEIASLIKNGKDINDIFILCKDNNCSYYLDLYKKSFGFEINSLSTNCLFDQSFFKKLVNIIKQEKSFDKASKFLDSLDNSDYIECATNLIKKVIKLDYSFDTCYSYFIEEAKTITSSSKRLLDAVKIIKKPTYLDNKTVFVLSFVQGQFPSAFKDNDYLQDKEKEELGINSSLDKGYIENYLWPSFFLSNNDFIFSYPFRDLQGMKFPSPLADSLGMENVFINSLPETIYSDDYALFSYVKALDLKRLYNITTLDLASFDQDNYQFNKGCFDPSFKPFDELTNKNKELTHSFSSIDEYFKCPYKYYLSKIIKIDPFKDNINTILGTLSHKIISRCFEDNFDFDSEFSKLINEYTFTNVQLLLLDKIKKYLAKGIESILLHKKYLRNPSYIQEKSFSLKLKDKTFLTGTIDNIVILDNEYSFLVDYKTGKNYSFKSNYLDVGSSMQLPTYSLLFHSLEEYKDIPLVGLYYHKILNYEDSVKDDELISKGLKLQGVTINESEVITKYLDPTLSSGKSSFIASLALIKDGNFNKHSKLAFRNEFQEYEMKVFNKYLEADEAIRQGSFFIKPLKIKDLDGCSFCGFKDICFYNNNDSNLLDNDDEGEE